MFKLRELVKLTNYGVTQVALISSIEVDDDDVPTDTGMVTKIADDGESVTVEFDEGCIIECKPDWLIKAPADA